MLSNNTIRSTMAGVASVLALSIAQQGLAQESFTVSGPVGYYYNIINGQYIYGAGVTFEATTTYDSTSPLSDFYSYGEDRWEWSVGSVGVFSQWQNSVSRTVITIRDSAGNVLQTKEVMSSGVDSNFYSRTERVVEDFYHIDDDYDFKYRQKMWSVWKDNGTSRSYANTWWTEEWSDSWPDEGPNFSVAAELAEVTTYPDPLDIAGWQYGRINAASYDSATNQSFYFGGSISSVTGGIQDTDGDGIKDDVDACVESDLSATVVVGSNDSKVGNTLLGNGCTITDMINTIRADESIHGQRVSGVADFLNAIKKDGVITGRQHGAIQNAVARAK